MAKIEVGCSSGEQRGHTATLNKLRPPALNCHCDTYICICQTGPGERFLKSPRTDRSKLICMYAYLYVVVIFE